VGAGHEALSPQITLSGRFVLSMDVRTEVRN
jgi:hypothetical protein